jgi:LysR family transcriptional regulator, chromosome initiation inhibitor
VTPFAVSQRIRQLEEHLGGIVVVRGAPCTLTVLGETLYRHALQVELLEQDLLPTVPERLLHRTALTAHSSGSPS